MRVLYYRGPDYYNFAEWMPEDMIYLADCLWIVPGTYTDAD